jgi:hypothetical protein
LLLIYYLQLMRDKLQHSGFSAIPATEGNFMWTKTGVQSLPNLVWILQFSDPPQRLDNIQAFFSANFSQTNKNTNATGGACYVRRITEDPPRAFPTAPNPDTRRT